MDAGVTNSNIPAEALLAHRHLRPVSFGTTADGVDWIEVETTNSHIRIGMGARMLGPDARRAGQPPGTDATPATRLKRRFYRDAVLELRDGVPTVLCKMVAIVSSRDTAISSPVGGALDVLARAPAGFDQILTAHASVWQRLLAAFALELETDRQTQLILNLHVFHVLQTLTPHTAELDAGVPARGLHGEGTAATCFGMSCSCFRFSHPAYPPSPNPCSTIAGGGWTQRGTPPGRQG